jgi:hypothetical protein
MDFDTIKIKEKILTIFCGVFKAKILSAISFNLVFEEVIFRKQNAKMTRNTIDEYVLEQAAVNKS